MSPQLWTLQPVSAPSCRPELNDLCQGSDLWPFLVQSVTVKQAITKKLKAQKSPLHHTRTSTCRTLVVHQDLLVGHIRSAPPVHLHTVRASEGNIWRCSSPFREPFLLLTPRLSCSRPTGRCPPPSARWRRTALPPRWPSSGSPGWIWCRSRLLPPWKRPWCAQRRCTRTDPQQRSLTARCWRAPRRRILWKTSPMREISVRWKRRPRWQLHNLQKVRRDFLIGCTPAWLYTYYFSCEFSLFLFFFLICNL